MDSPTVAPPSPNLRPVTAVCGGCFPSFPIQPTIPAPHPPSPLLFQPPPSPPIPFMSMAESSYSQPPPVTPIPRASFQSPVDILTYQYMGQMVYAPAGKTYEEALDAVQELYPELRDVDRSRISFHVTGAGDCFVRVPKMAWETVLLDVPRYEVVHVRVTDPVPGYEIVTVPPPVPCVVLPPPTYEGAPMSAPYISEKSKKRRTRGLWGMLKGLFGRD